MAGMANETESVAMQVDLVSEHDAFNFEQRRIEQN